MCARGGERVMMVPVTIDQAERRMTPRSRFAGGQVAEILARLGSPASVLMGVGSSVRCTRRWRGSERSRANKHATPRDHLNDSNVTAAVGPGRHPPAAPDGASPTR